MIQDFLDFLLVAILLAVLLTGVIRCEDDRLVIDKTRIEIIE